MLKKLINTYAPKWLSVVFDSNQPTFRHVLFKEYKLNRAKMPEELALQIPYILEIIDALGINIIQIPGMEADDIIGTLVTKAQMFNIFSIIVSGDKDLAQLVNEKVVIVNTMTNNLLDIQGVIDKFQVPPNLIIDYLVLIGDKVDNIPGVNNIGPKTAVKLLNKYKNLAGIIENIDLIPSKISENLKKAIHDLPLYVKLITIDTKISIDFHIDNFKIQDKKEKKLIDLFQDLEINSWLKDLRKKEKELTKVSLKPNCNKQFDNKKKELGLQCTGLETNKGLDWQCNGLETNKELDLQCNGLETNKELDLQCNKLDFSYDVLRLKKKIKFWIEQISNVDVFALHFNYAGLDPLNAKIIGIYLAINNIDDYLDFVDFNQILNLNLHNINLLIKLLLEFLIDPKKTKIVYNVKLLIRTLKNYNIQIKPPIIDLMLESYIINSSIRLDIDFKKLDAKTILTTHCDLMNKINSEKAIALLNEIELPLSLVLAKMEANGVLIDVEKLHNLHSVIQEKLQLLEDNIYKSSGVMFNLNSPKQLQEILYFKLQMPILEKTPKGQPSTAETVLQELSLEFELPNLILQYRTLSKLQSTYIDKLPKVINHTTGRVHTTYNQTITVTGRLSSSDPNLQNIPIKTEEGRKIREAFIAKAGFKILSIDYSQIELRILAHLSEDLGLIQAFNEHVDIHTVTASEIFNIDLSSVTRELRRRAKAINFGLIYGMSEFGLSKQLKITRLEADEYIKNYFFKFPKVLHFMDHIKKIAKEHGFVETMFGRRLYLSEINSKVIAKRKAAERAAINAPMQGAQADLIKLAMIKIDKWISEKNYENDILMLMQVHDELIFEVRESIIDLAKSVISEIMTNIVQLKVKLEVECGVGNNWGEAHCVG